MTGRERTWARFCLSETSWSPFSASSLASRRAPGRPCPSTGRTRRRAWFHAQPRFPLEKISTPSLDILTLRYDPRGARGDAETISLRVCDRRVTSTSARAPRSSTVPSKGAEVSRRSLFHFNVIVCEARRHKSTREPAGAFQEGASFRQADRQVITTTPRTARARRLCASRVARASAVERRPITRGVA